MTELSGPRLSLHLDSFYSTIIDEQQGKILKIHVSKPLETILGVGLQEHCP